MVHSARRIALLLASFDVALPSEREKPSWIDWTIEIFPSMRWVLLGRFPARSSRFRASHHSTYCARRSLTSYRPVVHTCSHFGARVRRRDMPRGTARAPPQVPQHFDGARANESLFAPPVDLISFTLYGVDYRTQESRFLNLSWLVPAMLPKHTICCSWWSITTYETYGRNKIAFYFWNLVSAPCTETGPNLRMSMLALDHQALHRGRY